MKCLKKIIARQFFSAEDRRWSIGLWVAMSKVGALADKGTQPIPALRQSQRSVGNFFHIGAHYQSAAALAIEMGNGGIQCIDRMNQIGRSAPALPPGADVTADHYVVICTQPSHKGSKVIMIDGKPRRAGL